MPSIDSLGLHHAIPPIDSIISDDKNSGTYLEPDIKDKVKEIEKELLDEIETLKLQFENDTITSSLL